MSPHSPELYTGQGRILALDLATKTGWAVWTGHARHSGVRNFKILDGELRGLLFQKFDAWLVDMLNPEPDLVVYEDPAAVRSKEAAAVLYGFVTRLWQAVDRRRIARRAVHIQTLKKWTTGKGNAKKPDMVAAVGRRFFPSPQFRDSLVGAFEQYVAPSKLDDNEADAIALLEYARQELVPQEVTR